MAAGGKIMKKDDSDKIRLMTKRKGKIIRKLDVDGQAQIHEVKFVA